MGESMVGAKRKSFFRRELFDYGRNLFVHSPWKMVVGRQLSYLNFRGVIIQISWSQIRIFLSWAINRPLCNRNWRIWEVFICLAEKKHFGTFPCKKILDLLSTFSVISISPHRPFPPQQRGTLPDHRRDHPRSDRDGLVGGCKFFHHKRSHLVYPLLSPFLEDHPI